MSRKCTICGKGPSSGKTISHSMRSTNRTFRPNLKSHKILVEGVAKKTKVCTSCLRSGKVEKAI